MSQHDLDLANQNGASFRGDLNNAIAAMTELNSGATEPAVTKPNMLWADTTSGYLKQRNAANSAWIIKSKLDQSYEDVENTKDIDKEVSTATQTQLDTKEVADTKIVKVNSGTLGVWTGTQVEYDALTPDADTLYFIQ